MALIPQRSQPGSGPAGASPAASRLGREEQRGAASASPAVTVNDLSHTYPGRPPIAALLNMSFAVSSAEIVAILGPSGSGKTTLLKILAGLLAPSSGAASVTGLSPAEARERRHSGLLFQNPVLLPWRTVGANITLPLELRSARQQFGALTTNRRSELARDTAALVGLADFWGAFPHQLSGGMRARVALARALTYRPSVLFLDEPFSSLDELTRARLHEDVLALQRATNATLLLVTHSVEEAAFLACRVMIFSPRPATLCGVFPSPAPPERTEWRESTAFFDFCRQLRGALKA